MEISMLKSKIHHATITQADLNYEGSITLDPDLIEAVGIIPYEQVDILDVNNGSRFTTYVILGERGSGQVCINGAAARLVQKGDIIIICSYCRVNMEEAKNHTPKIIILDKDNKIKVRKNA